MVAIATELAVAYISLAPSFKGGTSKIEKELGGVGATAGKTAGKGFGAAFGKAASLAVPLLAGAAILGQVKDVFAAASESRKIAALTEQVIKTTGGAAKLTADQVADLAGSLAKKTGVDDEVIQSGANLLLTFKNVRDEAGKGNDIFSQTTALANDMSVALGQDMTSSSMQLGKALNDPVKGMLALTRAGVSFSQEQKDQVKAMVESGDMLGAQKIILAEVEAQFGGAASAAATPMDKLKVVAGDLQEQLGEKLLPIVDKVASWLGDHLPSMVDRAGQVFGDLRDRLAPVVGFLGDVLDVGRQVAGFVQDEMVPRIRDAVADLTGGFTGDDTTGFLGGVGVAARDAYTFITETAIPGIQDAVGSFIAGFQGKGGEGSFFVDLAEGAAGAFRVFQEDVLPVLKTVAGFIRDHLKPILIGLALLFAPGAALVAGFIYAYQKSELFRDVVANVFAVVKFVVTNAIDAVVAVFNFLAPIIVSIAGFFTDTLLPAVQTAFAFIVDAVQSAWTGGIKPILDALVWFFETVVAPVFNFLKNVVVDIVFPLIVAAITDAWNIGIKPPLDALVWFFDAVLKPVFSTLKDIAVGAFQRVQDAVQIAWDFLQPILQSVIDFVQNKVSPIWDGLVAAAKTAFDLLPGIMAKVLQSVGDMVAGLLDLAAQVARNLQLDSVAEQMEKGADAARKWGDEVKKQSRDTDRGQGGMAVEGGIRRSAGGIIPGPGGRGDVVPVMATAGEFMMRRSAVDRFGSQFFAGLNAGHMPSTAGGGMTIENMSVHTVSNATAAETLDAVNAKLGWAHTARRDR